MRRGRGTSRSARDSRRRSDRRALFRRASRGIPVRHSRRRGRGAVSHLVGRCHCQRTRRRLPGRSSLRRTIRDREPAPRTPQRLPAFQWWPKPASSFTRRPHSSPMDHFLSGMGGCESLALADEATVRRCRESRASESFSPGRPRSVPPGRYRGDSRRWRPSSA